MPKQRLVVAVLWTVPVVDCRQDGVWCPLPYELVADFEHRPKLACRARRD